ncbi:MAG: hypothetical protein ACEPOV_04015 [Hyphomicrobiales bacterium]
MNPILKKMIKATIALLITFIIVSFVIGRNLYTENTTDIIIGVLIYNAVLCGILYLDKFITKGKEIEI